MTGRDLVSASLRLIGALAPGETLAAQEATDGLAALNRMLGSFSNESLLIHARVREEFTLTAGDQSYTMGSGADFNTTRPQKIDQALIRDESVSPALECPVDIVTLEEWAAIPSKQTEGEYPTALYAEGTFPNETINLYPKPTVAHKLVLFSWKPLTAIATLDTSVSLPPGYDEALIYNLAIRLSPEYGKAVPDAVAAIAMNSLAVIKRMNHRPRYLRINDVPADQARGAYNIFTGGY